MPCIKVLDDKTIDKIAAGEVVERPSSVVKELVENAIDAGAKAITVEIKDGGISMIRITDNGIGIEKEQIPLAFYRHSTSKLTTVEDLLTIQTMGFRGEALSSISSVSKVELLTKTAESVTGNRYIIEGGKEILFEEVGIPNGTTFIIRDLFYNTPARKKFLKSAQTEAGYINDIMEHLALANPGVAIKFINNGQMRIHTSGNGELKDIIYHIYGRDIANNIIEVNGEFEGCKVTGYIGNPVINRGNRNFESYFINGRYIKSKLLAKAIEDAYQGFVMQHKYPFTVLLFEIDGTKVDVNVHPNKMEIRFADSETLYINIMNLIHNTLKNRELIRKVSLGKEAAKKNDAPVPQATAPEPFEQKRIAKEAAPEKNHFNNDLLDKVKEQVKKDSPYENKYNRVIDTAQINESPVEFNKRNSSPKPSTEPYVRKQNPAKDYMAEQQTLAGYAAEVGAKLLERQSLAKHRIIGQLFGTYWLVEFEDNFYMIDQHAAHEKVLYERTINGLKNKQNTSQQLLSPIVVTLTMQEENLLNKYMEYFVQLGYEIESFGGKDYSISAVPGNLFNLNAKELFTEIIDSLSDIKGNDNPEVILEKIASMSCKAAVKGNHKMSFDEAKHLIDELMELENPYFCPHGRPVIISMSKSEVEKKFKRIL